VTGAGEEDRVEIVFVDEAIEVDVHEAEAGARPPVTEETLLDVLRLQRLSQQRIAAQVNHAGGQVRARPPVGVVFRSSSLVSRADVVTSALSTVGAAGVITRAIACSPFLQQRSKRSRSPCDHAFAVHHGEPCH
jgi:hypothetical protein